MTERLTQKQELEAGLRQALAEGEVAVAPEVDRAVEMRVGPALLGSEVPAVEPELTMRRRRCRDQEDRECFERVARGRSCAQLQWRPSHRLVRERRQVERDEITA